MKNYQKISKKAAHLKNVAHLEDVVCLENAAARFDMFLSEIDFLRSNVSHLDTRS